MKRVFCVLFSIILLAGVSACFNVQPAKASGIIYIRANGSVDPSDAPITTLDKVTYTLTGNVTSASDGIIVQRDNITIDGNQYTVQGPGTSLYYGINLAGRSNVTVKNTAISNFSRGIYLNYTDKATLSRNNITNNYDGIWLSNSSNNDISENYVTANEYDSIYLESSSGNSVSGNNITNNWHGIYLDSSSNNSISRNNITANNRYGIKLDSSSNNSISRNNITANNGYGVQLDFSSNNTLADNAMTDNECGFGVEGLNVSDFVNYVYTTNTVDGKPVCYWINRNGMAVPLDAGYVALVNCTHMTVQNLNLTNNGQGVVLAYTTDSTITNNSIASIGCSIYLYSSSNVSINENSGYGIDLYSSSNVSINENSGYGIDLYSSSNVSINENNITNNWLGIYLDSSSNNSISGNNITNNYDGIWLHSSSSNSITGNNVTGCQDMGIGLESFDSSNNSVAGNNITNNRWGIGLDSSSNKIYHNNFLNNTRQVLAPLTANTWDYGYPSGGNYWSNCSRSDLCRGTYQNETGSDGVGDAPYVIDESNLDRYPLMTLWYQISGDIDFDGKVSLADLVLLANAYGSKRGDAKWNFNADISENGKVDLSDLVALAQHYGQHNP